MSYQDTLVVAIFLTTEDKPTTPRDDSKGNLEQRTKLQLQEDRIHVSQQN